MEKKSLFPIILALLGVFALFALDVNKYLNGETIQMLQMNTNIDKDTNILGVCIKLVLWLGMSGYCAYMLYIDGIDLLGFMIAAICIFSLFSCAIDFISINVYEDLAAHRPIPEFYNKLGLIAESVLIFILSLVTVISVITMKK